MKHFVLSELPSTAGDAARAGLKHYFSGTPCKNGHVAARYITGNCMLCLRECRSRYRDDEARKQYYRANRERERETNRAYAQLKKAEIASRMKADRDAKPHLVRAKNAAWRASNPDYGQKHRTEKPHLYRAYKQNRRSREGTGKLSRDIVPTLWVKQSGICPLCTLPIGREYHIDHIIALAKGGENIDANVQLVHPKCNLRKGTRHV